jgi:mannitol operon transcriptional antiterminator
MLTLRQKDILRILYQSNQTITIRELAIALKVSIRTIRYDLKDLSYTLKSLNCRLSIVPSAGVSLEDASNKKWLDVFESDTHYDNQTRAITIVVQLLLYPKIQVKRMADRFQVSRQTITRDLNELSQSGLIKAEDLKRTTHGVMLTISEKQQRDLFCKSIQNSEFLQIALSEVETSLALSDEKIKSWIEHVEMSYGAEFESESKKVLHVIAGFISIRMLYQADKDIKVSGFLHSEMFDLLWDSDGCLRVERAMLTSRLTRGSLPVQTSPDLVEELIDNLIITLRLPIEAHDPAYQSLRLHLLAATNRSKFNQQIDNPLKDDVRLSYSILFEAISAVLKEFEDKHDISFSENEVAFIVMHIGAIFQSQSHLQSNITVAVVCQHGAATSNLLHSRLKLLMPNQNLLGPYSVGEFDTIKNSLNFDLIISTIHLEDRDVLVVSPLLSTKDIELIERKLWNLLYQKQCDLLIKNFRVSHQDKIYMHQLLKERHIQMKKPFDHWQKAIECAAKPLLEDGVILPRYTTKMIWAVESLGPYMVILPKIAFVHAGTQDGVVKNGISCLRMSSPIAFGNQKATDVQVIFVIASKAKEDMGLLKLVRIIENHDNYDLLLNTDDIKTILALEG